KNQLFIEFTSNDNMNLIDYVERKSIDIKETIDELSKTIKDSDDRILKFAGLNEKVKNELTNKESILVEINKKEMVTEHINRIFKDFNNIKEVKNFMSWSFEYRRLEKIGDDIYESNIITKSLHQEMKLLNKYEEMIIELDCQISRCKVAIEKFKNIPSLEDNMESFINENAQRIEKVFRLVHRPKEFSDISIENGEVSFIRVSTGEKTNISKVSTGQSVSLVFAITLCLHLSAESAPKFIILDEPVANMDDMHIINLIDIIRELALNGIQIFITTANNQVANYLRRKFSFFGKSFKHIKLERTDENPSDITEIVYSPFKETPIEFRKLS
ncbi:MAG: hypothetical protein KAH05_01530, partial [Clostridiales bacterium]|nr:hypothetical protein [Clostridiales bacterium]